MRGNFIFYLLILMSPIIFFLYISIKERIVYWRRIIYYVVFILGMFAYATHNIILFSALCIGMVVVILMDREQRINFPLKTLTILVILFLGLTLLINELGLMKLDAGEIFVRIWPFIPFIYGLRYLLSAKYDYQTGLILVEVAGIFAILNIAFFYGHQISWTVFGPIMFFVFWPLFFFLLSINIITGWLRTGDKKYMTIIKNKLIDGENWNHGDCSLFALMGTLELNLNKEDFDRDKIEKKTVRISTAAVMGKIIVRVPDEINIITDKKVDINKAKSLSFEGKEDLDSILDGSKNLSELLLRNKKIFGQIEIVKE